MRSVLIAVGSFVAMEPITALTHRAVMHGIGKGLHRSHHRRVRAGREQRWEANDLFPVMFAAIVMIGLAIGYGRPGWELLVPGGVGVTCYGAAYAVVHDIYTHHRLPLFGDHTVGALEWLAAKHRQHHQHGGAPYGMLVPISARVSRPSHDPLAP